MNRSPSQSPLDWVVPGSAGIPVVIAKGLTIELQQPIIAKGLGVMGGGVSSKTNLDDWVP